MPKYIATYRVVFEARDDADSVLIADTVQRAIEGRLEPEDGDSVELIECIDFSFQPTLAGTTDVLRKARNMLLRTRTRQGYYLAEELDKFAYQLDHSIDERMGTPGYDFGRITEIAAQVLKGKMPID